MLSNNVKKTVKKIKDEQSYDDSAANKGDSKKDKQAEVMIHLFHKQNPVVFRDQMDEAYAQIEVYGRKQIRRCESKTFARYLHHLFWKKTGCLINSENLTKVVSLIAAEAIYGDKQFKLYNRVAAYDGDFWYDLGNSKAVRIRKGTWEIVEEIPILFCSFQHQENQTLTLVQGEGNIHRLSKHIHLQTEDHRILLFVWLVAALIPEIAHAILVLFGGQGSAKSTTMRFLRRLIDPSKAGLLALPPVDEIVQQMAHHYTPFYDNVNKVYQNVSDILCRAVTGAGASKRRLFTDDDDVIYQYRRVISLNGINNVVENPDLHDRSIMIECKRIQKSDRKTEASVDKAFLEDQPYILGGIFDVLAAARLQFDDVSLTELPRMADFAKWGYAIAEVLGFGGDSFLKAYEANINQQNEEVLENDPVAHTISHLMNDFGEWEGTPTELHDKLLELAIELKINAKAMPKTPASLGKRINIVHSNLLECGILIEKRKDTAERRGRFYEIRKIPDEIDAAIATPDVYKPDSAGNVGRDGRNDNLSKPADDELKAEEIFGPGTKVDDLPFN